MTKPPRFPHYLKRRAGKSRSGQRYYIRVPIPPGLRDRFGKLRHIERALGASDPDEAQRRSRPEIEQVLAMFDRMRSGGPLRSRAMAIVERIGAEPTAETVGALADELANAALAAQAYWRRGVQPAPTNGQAKPQRSKRGSAPIVSKAAADFVANRMRDPSDAWTAQTKKQNEAVYRLFADHVGDSPVDTITSDDAVSFRSAVARLWPDWARSAKAKDMPLSELLKRFGAKEGEPGLSNKTLDRYMSAMVSLFK